MASIQGLVNDLARLAHANGRFDLEERVRGEAARWSARGTTVVVVGETGRGRRGFLRQRPARQARGLLPVEDDSSTSVHIVIRYSPTVTVRVHQEGGEASQEIVLERIREWATDRGTASNGQRVQAVEIGLDPAPPRQRSRRRRYAGRRQPVVGFPAEATLAALAWADALILVTSAAAPLAAPEIAFLERAAERVETIIVALTKTDAHPGWRAILEDDLAILHQRLPVYADAPVFPVEQPAEGPRGSSHRRG